jgi:hypothetical protein
LSCAELIIPFVAQAGLARETNSFFLDTTPDFAHFKPDTNSSTMKKHLLLLGTATLCLGLSPAFAQPGPPEGSAGFDSAMSKLFGDNSAFTAALETQIKPKSGGLITMPGKIFFDSGKARMEMNLLAATGLNLPPGSAIQMKSMGLDQMTTISLPEKKSVLLIYPGLQSYVENPLPAAAAVTNWNFKVTTTELGKATVAGHPCVENKVFVTDAKGTTNEFTVWNATDLKNFPVKIFRGGPEADVTMSFTDVSLTKPAASSFNPPAGYTRYDNVQTMMQTEMMKKMGGGLGLPPAEPPTTK